MKLQALFSSKNKSKKKLKCRLLQVLFGALRVNDFASFKQLRTQLTLLVLNNCEPSKHALLKQH